VVVVVVVVVVEVVVEVVVVVVVVAAVVWGVRGIWESFSSVLLKLMRRFIAICGNRFCLDICLEWSDGWVVRRG
jgi:hypothetical protein